MTIRLNNQEYLWLKCTSCGDRCKLAKNKGIQNWVAYKARGARWIEEFLREHSDCDLELEVSQ